MENIKIETIELILLIGAIVAIVARRLKIPYTVGLVVAGICITFLPTSIAVGKGTLSYMGKNICHRSDFLTRKSGRQKPC